MNYGFKYQKQEQKEIEIAEQTTEPEEGQCVICGEYTTLILEHENIVTTYIPVCKKHLNAVRAKERAIESILDALKIVILT